MTGKKVSLFYLLFTFLKIGSVSFGGFMALISVIQNQLVEKDKKLTDETVLDGISLASVLPGPMAVNVVTYIGYKLRGVTGALVSMIAIITPSFILLYLLSVIYFRFGNVITIDKVFKGIMPAVSAIIIVVAVNMSKKTIKDYKQVLLATVSGVVLILSKGFFTTFVMIIVGGVAGIFFYYKRNKAVDVTRKIQIKKNNRIWKVSLAIIAIVFMLFLVVWFIPPHRNEFIDRIINIAVVFSGLSVSLFGGGYVMIPAMHDIIVSNLHWLSSKEFADGIAMGQVTPGPIFISAAFVGYKLYGFPGALEATIFMFLPSAVIMVISSQFIDFIKNSDLVIAIFKGLRPAVIGMIFSASIIIARGIEPDLMAVVIFVSVIVLSLKFKLNPVYVIPLAGLASYVIN